MSPKFMIRTLLSWQGLVLAAAALVPTLWLALTNQLILYIHPRYVVFTAIMAAIGLVFVVAGVVARFRAQHGGPSEHGHAGYEHAAYEHAAYEHAAYEHAAYEHAEHDHAEHDHQPVAPTSRAGRTIASVGALLALTVAVGLVIVPPATLTTATADQRVINSTSVGSAVVGSASVASASVASASGAVAGSAASTLAGASAKFTVLDWSALLRQTTDANFYRNKPVDVTGFVTADSTAPTDLFYVSRFVITCCAVDAQPVGVPVYLPGWKAHFAPNEWVHVTGAFGTNPSTASSQSIALLPLATKKVGQPRDPYLY